MKMADTDNPNLRISDLENMFTVHVDRKGNYAFNLNEGLYLSYDTTNLPKIKLDHDLFWTTISYKIYGTTRLAWLLMKINGIEADRIFDIQTTGTDIYYLSKETVNRLLTEIRK